MDAPVLLLKNNNGINVDSNFYILEDSIIKIGRDSSADLKIPDPFISRFQAEIYFENEKWFIRDPQSKNGTFVNGVKIGPDPVRLNHGDVICFCNKIEYLYQEEKVDLLDTRSMAIPVAPYGIIMNEKSEEVIVDGVRLNPRLGPVEWQFLSLLMREPDRIHTYKELAREMYNVEADIFAIEPYKKMLHTVKRDIVKKLEKQGITREVIKSRNSVGYQLVEKDSQ